MCPPGTGPPHSLLSSLGWPPPGSPPAPSHTEPPHLDTHGLPGLRAALGTSWKQSGPVLCPGADASPHTELRALFSSTQTKLKPKRVKALYNCVADNPDELTFSEGDVIIVDGEEDQEWWVSRGLAGLFPGEARCAPDEPPLPFPWTHF